MANKLFAPKSNTEQKSGTESKGIDFVARASRALEAEKIGGKFGTRNKMPMMVTDVVDGDTFKARLPDGSIQTIRLGGETNAPEFASRRGGHEAGSTRAKEWLENKIGGKVILFRPQNHTLKQEDQFGRWIGDATVYGDEKQEGAAKGTRDKEYDKGLSIWNSAKYYTLSTLASINRNIGGLMMQAEGGEMANVSLGEIGTKGDLEKALWNAKAVMSSGQYLVRQADIMRQMIETPGGPVDARNPQEAILKGTASQKIKAYTGQLLKNPTILAGKILESSPLMASGIGGTMVTGSPVGGAIAMMASISGNNYADMRAANVTHEDAMLWGNAAALGEAVIEQLTLNRLGSIVKSGQTFLAKKLTPSLRGPVIGAFTRGLEGGAVGMAEEVSQTMVNNAAAIASGQQDITLMQGTLQAGTEGWWLESAMSQGAYAIHRASGGKADIDVGATILDEVVQKVESKKLQEALIEADRAIEESGARKEDKDQAREVLSEVVAKYLQGGLVPLTKTNLLSELPEAIDADKMGIDISETEDGITATQRVKLEEAKEGWTLEKLDAALEETRRKQAPSITDSETTTDPATVGSTDITSDEAINMGDSQGQGEVRKSDSEQIPDTEKTSEELVDEASTLFSVNKKGLMFYKGKELSKISNEELDKVYNLLGLTSFRDLPASTNLGIQRVKLEAVAREALKRESTRMALEEQVYETTPETEEGTEATEGSPYEAETDELQKIDTPTQQTGYSKATIDEKEKIDFVLRSKLKIPAQHLDNARANASIVGDRVYFDGNAYEVGRNRYTEKGLVKRTVEQLKAIAKKLGAKVDVAAIENTALDVAANKSKKGYSVKKEEASEKRQLTRVILKIDAQMRVDKTLTGEDLLREEDVSRGTKSFQTRDTGGKEGKVTIEEKSLLASKLETSQDAGLSADALRQEKRAGVKTEARDTKSPETSPLDMSDIFEELYMLAEKKGKLGSVNSQEERAWIRKVTDAMLERGLTKEEASAAAYQLRQFIHRLGGDILAPRWGLSQFYEQGEYQRERYSKKALLDDAAKYAKREIQRKRWREWAHKQLKQGKVTDDIYHAFVKRLEANKGIFGQTKATALQILKVVENEATKQDKTRKVFLPRTGKNVEVSTKTGKQVETPIASDLAGKDKILLEGGEIGVTTDNLDGTTPESLGMVDSSPEAVKKTKKVIKAAKKSAKASEVAPFNIKEFKKELKQALATLGIREGRAKWLSGGAALLHQFFGEERLAKSIAKRDHQKLIIKLANIFGQKQYNATSQELYFDGHTVAEADEAAKLAIDIRNFEGTEGFGKWIEGLNNEKGRIVALARRINTAKEGKLLDLRKIVDEVDSQAEAQGMEASKEGLFKGGTWKHYITHIWDFGKFEGKTAVPFSQDPSQTHQRTFTEGGIVEGWAKGYELRAKSFADTALESRYKLAMATADRRMIKFGVKGGIFRNATQKPVGFELIEHGGFYDRTGPKGTQLYAEEKVAKHLNNSFGQSAMKGIWGVDFLTKWNAILKRILLVASMFHARAFVWSAVAGAPKMWTNPIKMYKMGKQMWETQSHELQQLVYHGTTVFEELDYDPTEARRRTALGKMMEKNALTDASWKTTVKLFEKFERALFGMGSNLKLGSANMNVQYMKKKYASQLASGEMTMDQIYAEVSARVNSDFGGRDYQREGFNPTALHGFRLAFLGYDWTLSNVETVYRAVKGRTESETAIYRKMWTSIALHYAVLWTLGNIFAGALDDDDDVIDNLKNAWDAGGLKVLDVDITPLYKLAGGDDGRDRYLNILGHFKDVAKWATQSPAKSFYHKSGIFTRPAIELAKGSDYSTAGFVDNKTFLKSLKGGGPLFKKAKTTEFSYKDDDKGFVTPDNLMAYLASQISAGMPIPSQLIMDFLRGQQGGFDVTVQAIGGDSKINYRQER